MAWGYAGTFAESHQLHVLVGSHRVAMLWLNFNKTGSDTALQTNGHSPVPRGSPGVSGSFQGRLIADRGWGSIW